MSGPVSPESDPPPRRGKWILLAFLVALAAFMYVIIIVKTSKYGF